MAKKQLYCDDFNSADTCSARFFFCVLWLMLGLKVTINDDFPKLLSFSSIFVSTKKRWGCQEPCCCEIGASAFYQSEVADLGVWVSEDSWRCRNSDRELNEWMISHRCKFDAVTKSCRYPNLVHPRFSSPFVFTKNHQNMENCGF